MIHPPSRFRFPALRGSGLPVLLAAGIASLSGIASAAEAAHGPAEAPSLFWSAPFALLLLSIAVLPLVPRVNHWWHKNSSKLLVSAVLGVLVSAYYTLRGRGFHEAGAGFASAEYLLKHAIVGDYIPFMALLFSLYTISGGIRLAGSIRPSTRVNAGFLATGALIASFIGTTGASMLLIRPLLQINRGRKHVVHTVVFFIFLVSNLGGLLLPVGDPPLFLGYLRGVPFFWTLKLLPQWLFCNALILSIYIIWDFLVSRREEAAPPDGPAEPMRVEGGINLLFLALVVAAVALLVPGKTLPGTSIVIPPWFLREAVQLALAGLSMALTPRAIREANEFNFGAIGEVGALFIGIFLTMQPPIEMLQAMGPKLGLTEPWHFFWASGTLSSVLDNAPTYVVFYEAAGALPASGAMLEGLNTATGGINAELLKAVSCGSVFMGANTYIGNGPNFMVKSIAEQYQVRMPGFFGYMLYSGAILIPCFAMVTFLFFR